MKVEPIALPISTNSLKTHAHCAFELFVHAHFFLIVIDRGGRTNTKTHADRTIYADFSVLIYASP